jgi:hypothetical protein
MEDRRSHCQEASLYKSHGRRKGTRIWIPTVVEVQIVVAWSVANDGGLPKVVIGSPREKVAAFQTRLHPHRHVQLQVSQLRQLLTTKSKYLNGAAKLLRGHLLNHTDAFRAWRMGCCQQRFSCRTIRIHRR